MTAPKPKIFVFADDAGQGIEWCGMAVCEDGILLAGCVSTSRDDFRHEMGLSSGLKHEAYRRHYPLGYELVEVPDDEVATHPGLAAALNRVEALAQVAKDRP
jgi:hypothetical protein